MAELDFFNPKYNETPSPKLTLENIDDVFKTSLLKADKNHDRKLDEGELKSTETMTGISEAEKDLFKILRESRETIANLGDRKLIFSDNKVGLEDIQSLQQIGKDGSGSLWTIARMTFDNQLSRWMISSGVMTVAEYGWLGAPALPEALIAGVAFGTVYTGLNAAVQGGGYLISDKAVVDKVLNQLK